MLRCTRQVPKGASFDNSVEAFLRVNDDLVIKESSFMVDGIGGTTWDGSLVLMWFLLKYRDALSSMMKEFSPSLQILELGAGCGVVSLFVSKIGGFSVTCTDREVDLIEENMQRNNVSTGHMNVHTLNWGDTKKTIGPGTTSSFLNTTVDRLSSGNRYSIICGAEIVVLNKQHDILIDTVDANADDDTLILFTFDELSASSQGVLYKKQFIEKMSRKGYQCRNMMDGEVSWSKVLNIDDANVFNDFVASIRVNGEIKESNVIEEGAIHTESLRFERSTQHHLLAFYKNEASVALSMAMYII